MAKIAVLLYVPIYLACALGAGLLWRSPILLFLLYSALSIVLLWRWHSRSDLVYFAVPAVLGPLGEILAVRLGAWQYSDAPYILPIWLPLAWGISMLFMKKTAEALAH